MSTKRIIYRDLALDPATDEYLAVTFTSRPTAPDEPAVDLDAQPVRFSFDRVTYFDAAWHGGQWAEGVNKLRIAWLLMDDDNLPAKGTTSPIFGRVTDTPEAPIIPAGYLTVR